MRFTADLHIHSKYSRATSKDMDLEHISEWAGYKGIDLVGTGDFTHPFWYAELKKKLKDEGNGLFSFGKTRFMLTTEVCNIFHKDEKLRKVHTMIFAPSFEAVDRINKELTRLADLMSDGRPVFTISSKKLAEIVLSASRECMIVPAHIWTPWFSMFGSNSGFDSIPECFEEYSRNIFAAETGLSSDPSMNWRVSKLDRICLISNSDAHSPAKIGREANIFNTDMSYSAIYEALRKKDGTKLVSTIEFYPEEGKYHHDGHSGCNVMMSPEETKKKKGKCPVCKKQLTIGVLNRIDQLADRPDGYTPENAIPFRSLIPLTEIISEVIEKGIDTMAVKNEYTRLVSTFGNEMKILNEIPLKDLKAYSSSEVAEAVGRVRDGRIKIIPGYDGQYGTVKVFEEPVKKRVPVQAGLF